MTKLLKPLLNRSPSENYQRLKAKLFTGTSDFLYDLETILHSSWHLDARRPIDRLFRYQRVIRNQIEWEELDFGGMTVLEFGCGPLLGWGPIAVYLGCSRYICVEPRFHEEIVRSMDIHNRYFLPLHQQLEAIFQRNMPFGEFKTRLSSQVETYAMPLEACKLPQVSTDLIISNGVLQHVLDLPGCFQQMQHLAHPKTKHFHVLNFTDHSGRPDKPFDKIYSQSPEDYFKNSSLLNLKRPSEMMALFEEYGFKVTLVPYYQDNCVSSAIRADYWKKFSQDDLSIQIAFIVN